MKEYYTVAELARIVNIEYHAVYYHITKKQIPVIRSGVKPNQVITIAHADLATFLLTVDWLMTTKLPDDHPFQAERQKFAQRYMHRSDIATQACVSVDTIANWICLHQFPRPVIRNGWFARKAVLHWFKVNRPETYQHIQRSNV